MQIARFSAKRRSPRPGLRPSNLSYFLNGHRKHPLNFDDLEDIGFYYNLTIADLFGLTRAKNDLSAEEERLLLAYRAARPDVQGMAITVLELGADHGPGHAPKRRFAAA